MKKTVFVILITMAALAAVLVYRAETTFVNHQLEPAAGIEAIDLNEREAVQRFSKALTFPTVSHQDRSQFDQAAFRGFHAFLEKSFPQVHRQATKTVVNELSLVYRLQGSDPSLEPVLFMAHMDVVPADESTLAEWSHPPFGGVVDKGVVWGRGSIDDKLTVMALMEAAELLLSENRQPRRTVYFAFGHDEEVGGRDGAAEIAKYFKTKGITFDFILDEGGAVVEGMIQDIERPVAVIGVSEKGFVNLVLTVNSPGGHSSQPPDQTAVGILSRAIVAVEDNPFPATLDFMYPTFEMLAVEMPFSRRLIMSNLWLFSPLVKSVMLGNKDDAAGLRTTTAATMFSGSSRPNILPTQAQAVINFRILPGETADSVEQRVTGLVNDGRVKISSESAVDPSPLSPLDTRGYGLIASTIRGMDERIWVTPYMVRAGTDAKHFQGLSPNVYRFMFLRMNARTLELIHGIDEHVTVEHYIEAVRYYYHLVRRSMEG